jgi:hypothetical protein
MLFGPVVADLVAASDSFDDDDTDPLDALCDTAAGYDSSFPLEENEIDLVYNEIDLFSTFGGNPVACAAGMALLDEIERRDLVKKSHELGDYFRSSQPS